VDEELGLTHVKASFTWAKPSSVRVHCTLHEEMVLQMNWQQKKTWVGNRKEVLWLLTPTESLSPEFEKTSYCFKVFTYSLVYNLNMLEKTMESSWLSKICEIKEDKRSTAKHVVSVLRKAWSWTEECAR